jgi:hypothetical protein
VLSLFWFQSFDKDFWIVRPGEPRDPSVAVYWVEHGVWNVQRQDYDYKQRVVPCDHARNKVKQNLRAVGVAIEAPRELAAR